LRSASVFESLWEVGHVGRLDCSPKVAARERQIGSEHAAHLVDVRFIA
jgi:hypothetical protein